MCLVFLNIHPWFGLRLFFASVRARKTLVYVQQVRVLLASLSIFLWYGAVFLEEHL